MKQTCIKKKYKNRHNFVGKVIHFELCKRLNFDYTAEWYIHKPESVLENEIHKILWDFEIQTDHLIQARKPDLMLINEKKENLSSSEFCRSSGPQSKNK